MFKVWVCGGISRLNIQTVTHVRDSLFEHRAIFTNAPLLIGDVQSDPLYKNPSLGYKSLESCADVTSDVDLKAETRLLRFL